jgi:tRNA A37 threonylcarbamoyladenosine biosynthesis protein TsaE
LLRNEFQQTLVGLSVDRGSGKTYFQRIAMHANHPGFLGARLNVQA